MVTPGFFLSLFHLDINFYQQYHLYTVEATVDTPYLTVSEHFNTSLANINTYLGTIIKKD